jgi:hypothetical protein
MVKLFGAAFLAVCSLTKVVQAAKDDSYYPGGISNPNVKQKMYWHDAHNVLQDLSLFQELRIQFHSCAWTPILSNSEQGRSEGETDSWYYGKQIVYCFT